MYNYLTCFTLYYETNKTKVKFESYAPKQQAISSHPSAVNVTGVSVTTDPRLLLRQCRILQTSTKKNSRE